MISLRELDSKSISHEYISAMKNKSSIQFTGARFVDWDVEKIRDYVEINSRSEDSILFGVFNSSTHLGNVRIHSIDRRNSTCELGIIIFDQVYRGKGLGSQALRLAINYVFDELKVTRIMADYFEENSASERLFYKNGFLIEGRFKNHFKNLDGTYSNSVRVALNQEGER